MDRQPWNCPAVILTTRDALTQLSLLSLAIGLFKTLRGTRGLAVAQAALVKARRIPHHCQQLTRVSRLSHRNGRCPLVNVGKCQGYLGAFFKGYFVPAILFVNFLSHPRQVAAIRQDHLTLSFYLYYFALILLVSV